MAVLGSYPAIVSGLSSLGTENRPEAFIYNEELYMIAARFNAPIQGYKWNSGTSEWELNSLFETFDVSPGNAQIPSVFYYNSDLYLICGSNYSTYKGFKWNALNSRWEVNAVIITGLTVIAYNSPTVFNIGEELFLVEGNQAGTFSGYKWNSETSEWESDSAIILGLSDVGNYSRPESFYYGGNLYLYHSNNYRWKWNVNQWEAVTLGGGTPGGRPTFFEKDGFTFAIFGSTSGSFTGYRLNSSAKITSITAEEGLNIKAKLVVNLSEALETGDELTAYNAPSVAGYGNPLYLVELTQVDSVTWEYQTDIEEGTQFYFNAVQIWGGSQIDSASLSTTFWILPAITPKVINITDANNYKILNSPSHNYSHGSLIYNGYIYGSARNSATLGDADIFKIEAADYSNLLQQTIYQNKTAQTTRIFLFDQIIQSDGFLWVHRQQYLIRINVSDLDYMIFSGLPEATRGEPLISDDNYIYLTAGLNLTRIDKSLLLGSFASYGYDGSAPVSIPLAAVIDTCAFIQLHPTENVLCHSVVDDGTYLFCAQTTPVTTENGYDSDLDINMCHCQKIRKSDMTSIGDVAIPRTTDDMVQNNDYIFLAPEISGIPNINQLGYTWNLIAINKLTLEIKYLKSLYPRQKDRVNAYGVFYFNNKIIVQQIVTKATIVIDISEVESWGDNFPIGGATDVIFTFQLNGVDFTASCNELNLDDNGWVHTNTWEEDTMVFKFQLTELGEISETYNAMKLSYDDAIALLELIDTNHGCSIRCVQDAPGIADGVTGIETDIDGNTYHTVVINQKRWFVENLRTTKYRNGNTVPDVTDPTTWAALTDGGRCEYIESTTTTTTSEPTTTTTTTTTLEVTTTTTTIPETTTTTTTLSGIGYMIIGSTFIVT